MKYLVFVPDALVVATAVVVLLAGRFGWIRRSWRPLVPVAVVVVTLVGLGIELWAGATLGTYFGGALLQDRFALFAKSAALLTTAAVIATADWPAEDSFSIAVAMPLLAAFGVMVAASSADLVGVWAGLELAGVAGVVVVALRRPDLGLRLLIAGAVATTFLLMGLAYLYAATGNVDLSGIRAVLLYQVPTLPLAIPLLLLVAGLALRAGVAPFHVATLPAELGASPLGAGTVVGLVALAAGVAGVKIAAALVPIPAPISPGLAVVGAVAIVAGGASALAVRAPRSRLAYLGVAQVGWVAAGLSSHSRAGIGGSLFLLGAFALAATCAPALLGRTDGGEAALAGWGRLRPARAAGFALAVLSLAGAPLLPGAFGELAVGASLAQNGQWWLLSLGAVGWILSVAAAVGVLRVLYIQTPLEEGRRGVGAALPSLTTFSTVGAVAFCFVLAGYVVFANPIMGLADQGAEALGLR